MTVAETFTALCAGQRPGDDGLLGNGRLEWGGGEAYGEEAILESFRAAPIDPARGDLVIGTTAAAWVGADSALVADLYDGRIGRLWRLGTGPSPVPEPAIAVAFDTDLRQKRGDVAFRAADHPALDVVAHDAVTAAGQALLHVDQIPALHRARAFVVRAFLADETTVALYAIHRLTGEAPRRAGFGYAIALIEAGAAPRLIVDPWSPTDWTPRL